MKLVLKNNTIFATHDNKIEIDFKQAYGKDVDVVIVPDTFNLNTVSESVFIQQPLFDISDPASLTAARLEELEQYRLQAEQTLSNNQEYEYISLEELKSKINDHFKLASFTKEQLVTLFTTGLQDLNDCSFIRDLLLEVGPSKELIEEAIAEVNVNSKRELAYLHITKYYPMWKQINITNSTDAQIKATMLRFIEEVRAWSNIQDSTVEQLEAIVA